MTLEQLLKREGQDVVARLRASYAKFGVNATGNLSRSTSEEVTKDGSKSTLEVSVPAYGLTTQTGRGPTRNSQGGVLLQQIRKWIDAKGITPDKGTKEGLAYAITKKIHEQGTRTFRKGGQPVISSVVNDATINDIETQIGRWAQGTALEKIDAEIKRF